MGVHQGPLNSPLLFVMVFEDMCTSIYAHLQTVYPPFLVRLLGCLEIQDLFLFLSIAK